MVRKLKGPGRPVVRTQPALDPSAERAAQLQRAAAHYNAGRLDEADAVYVELGTRDPQDAMPPYLRGLLAFQRGRYVDAVELLRRALALCGEAPLRLDVLIWLGKALTARAEFREAQVHLNAAAKLVWDDGAKLGALIPLLILANGFDDMEPLLFRVLELDPEHPVAHGELALFRFRLRDFASVMRHVERALQKDPTSPPALRVLGHVHHDIGEVKEGAARYRAAVEGVLQGKGHTNLLATYESMLGALVYADVSDAELRAAHERWQTLMGSRPRPRKPLRPRLERPLRIGYVSPDFRHHAVAFFFEPLLQNHDPAVVTPLLYSNTAKHDSVSERLRAKAAGWRDILDVPDEQVADWVEQDEVDILVDLAGYTVGNRMGVFHLRPAPLQVNYLGYPCTTGLAQMDYRFTDEDCDPLGETDAVYTEKLVRLPGGFYAWQPPDEYPAVAEPPVLQNGFLTFGSLNTLAKLTNDVVVLWSRLLGEVPRSRLVLQAESFSDPWVRERILGKFAAHGVDASRIDLHGRMPMVEHLGMYGQIDIALDPFPWGGHTTTCTALFMGVPVVTLRGRRMASRMSASVLRRLGYDALIADTPEQYLHIARELAAKGGQVLGALRSSQRALFASSDLTDGARLARVVEAAYQTIWDHHAGR